MHAIPHLGIFVLGALLGEPGELVLSNQGDKSCKLGHNCLRTHVGRHLQLGKYLVARLPSLISWLMTACLRTVNAYVPSPLRLENQLELPVRPLLGPK